ncbi:hypothetical protein BHM03_00000928 [Ensete ventricosum]|nr:hypothetical protein BHM03_00000928 [Ensete ventricosum]
MALVDRASSLVALRLGLGISPCGASYDLRAAQLLILWLWWLAVDQGRMLNRKRGVWLGHERGQLRRRHLLSDLGHHPCKSLEVVGETKECLDRDDGVPHVPSMGREPMIVK